MIDDFGLTPCAESEDILGSALASGIAILQGEQTVSDQDKTTTVPSEAERRMNELDARVAALEEKTAWIAPLSEVQHAMSVWDTKLCPLTESEAAAPIPTQTVTEFPANNVEEIRAILKAVGVTTAALSKTNGVHQHTIQPLLNPSRKTGYTVSSLRKIARLLGMELRITFVKKSDLQP